MAIDEELAMQRQVILTFLLVAVSGLSACRWHPESPLARAIDRGDIDAIRRLAPSSPAVDRSEALIWASRLGQTAALDALIDAGVTPDFRDDRHGWTPLLHAVHKNQRSAVGRLLARGATPDYGTASGFTPLMMAAGYGYPEIVQLLLDAGANPHTQSRNGITALSAAVGGASDIDRWTVGTCQTGTVRLLLERFPDLRMPDNADGRRSAWIARNIGRCSTITEMLKSRS